MPLWFDLAVQGASVDDGLSLSVGTEDDQQVRHHGGLPLFVQIDHFALTQLLVETVTTARSTSGNSRISTP